MLDIIMHLNTLINIFNIVNKMSLIDGESGCRGNAVHYACLSESGMVDCVKFRDKDVSIVQPIDQTECMRYATRIV